MTRHCWACIALTIALGASPQNAVGQRQAEPLVAARTRTVLVYSADTGASRAGSTDTLPLWAAPPDPTASHLRTRAHAHTRTRAHADPSCRARGPIAIRGAFLGAVAGGILGFALGSREEYGGAAIGAVGGALVGAPVGMVTLLLLTPFTPC